MSAAAPSVGFADGGAASPKGRGLRALASEARLRAKGEGLSARLIVLGPSPFSPKLTLFAKAQSPLPLGEEVQGRPIVTTGNARRLRREMTDAERRLWAYLRNKQLGVKFVF